MVAIRKYGDRTSTPYESVGESRTKQSFRDECDINNLMDNWRATGNMAHTNQTPPVYGDFSDVTDYQTAVLQVQAATEGFASLSARLRARFHNSPEELLAFTSDPENLEACVELGLLEDPDPELTYARKAQARSQEAAAAHRAKNMPKAAAEAETPPETPA